MKWSNHGDEAEEKQRSSDERKPEQMRSRGGQDEAEHKQPRADEDKERPGLNHLGRNRKERLNATDGNVGHGEQENRTRGRGSGEAAKQSGGRGQGEAEKPR